MGQNRLCYTAMECLSLTHSRSDYVHKKCICPLGRRANAIYKRDKAADHRANTASETAKKGTTCLHDCKQELTCGLHTTYEWYGCRGQDCTKAKAAQWQEYKFLRQVSA